jgi:hypothetical protein
MYMYKVQLNLGYINLNPKPLFLTKDGLGPKSPMFSEREAFDELLVASLLNVRGLGFEPRQE